MGSDYLLIPVWRSVDDGLTGKGYTSLLTICETCLHWPHIVDKCSCIIAFATYAIFGTLSGMVDRSDVELPQWKP